MPYEAIKVATDERGVCRLTFSRPDKHNALNPQMMDEVTAAVAEIGSDTNIRIVIVAGAGRSFCAGGDLDWMRQQRDADRAGRIREARRIATMLGALNALEKPTIARVHGAAYGGGVGIMCVCDHVIMSDAAKFGLTETGLGLIPATIGPYVAARLGNGPARRVFMSGARHGAAKALAIGLTERVIEPELLDAAVDACVRPYLSAAPGAIARSKRLLNALERSIDEAAIEMSIEALADCWETEEARDGIAAFFAGTKPGWVRTV